MQALFYFQLVLSCESLSGLTQQRATGAILLMSNYNDCISFFFHSPQQYHHPAAAKLLDQVGQVEAAAVPNTATTQHC